jgi:hypothetical protein
MQAFGLCLVVSPFEKSGSQIQLPNPAPHEKFSYLNEDEVGIGLRESISRNPDVKRSDIFITTKVWPHLSEPEVVEWSSNY